MNKKITVKNRHRHRHRHRYTRSQSGGIKVLLPNIHDNIMEREVRTRNQLYDILNNTRKIEVVSTGSLNSFVLRLHLDPANILFRSDTISEEKKLFSQQHKSLSYSKIDNETDGLPIHEIIIKICLMHTRRDNITIEDFNGVEKSSVTADELQNEYNTQRYLYSSMMSISGNPFCPDAIGIVTMNPPPATNPPTFIDILKSVPNINGMLQADPILKSVNTYINRHVNFGLHVGIIIMESIPPTYNPIYKYSLTTQPGYNEEIYKKLCEGIAAINILSIYRGKMFHLDAHPGNWLCNPSAPMLQQIKEIDFGRVYRIDDNRANIEHFISDTKTNIGIYVKYKIKNNEAVKIFLNRFYSMMGVEPANLAIYTSEQNLNTKIRYAQEVFETEINNIIDTFTSVDLFSKPYNTMSPDERRMNIKMIHRLILISVLVDSFYNSVKCNIEQGQISHIYNIILNIPVLNPRTIVEYPILIDLDDYNLIHHEKAVKLTETYPRIYDIIYEYCKENNFPSIRKYKRFKEIQYSRAQNAWMKLKNLGAGILLCSSKVREKVANYSRVLGSALSYIPGSSNVSNIAYGVYDKALDKALDVKYFLERSSINALRKLKSTVSRATPYEPILPPSYRKSRASSPPILHRILPSDTVSDKVGNIELKSLRAYHTSRKHRRTKKNIKKYTIQSKKYTTKC